MLRKILNLGAFIGVAVIFAFLVLNRFPTGLKVGSSAPISEKIELINGDLTTFKALLKKPMVVNFWAIWCPSCIKELPIFNKMAKKYHEKMIFLGATLGSSKKEIMQAKKKYSLIYEFALISESVARKWQGQALPTTYIIEPAGKIVWAKTGVFDESELEKAIQLILKKPFGS
jgi:thiol-disulfide isomerase/thioredoxin